MGALAPRGRPAGNQSRTWLRFRICLDRLSIAVAGLALVLGAGDVAEAAKARSQQRQVASIETRDGGEPLMAVVSLRSQQITVYDADGWILRSPVSSGQKGRETLRPVSSASSRNKPSTTPTSMTTPSCRTCTV